jgi:hypothetical protein
MEKEFSEIHTKTKILQEIFSIPLDLFDFFLSNSIKKIEIIFLHLILWIHAPICKLLLNYLTLFYFQSSELESNIKLTDGLIFSFLIYPLGFSFLYIFEKYEIVFLENIDHPNNISVIFLAFFPFSASCIFWLLPKPLNFFGICFSIFVSLNNYYQALLNLKNLEKTKILKLFIIFFIIFFFFSFIFLTIFSYIRNS